jgi:uncharacterized protein YeaO (DUF488 family)
VIKETYYSVRKKIVPQRDVVFDISRFRKKKVAISPLAPSQDLLRDWNEDRIVWKEYVERYYQELKAKKEVDPLIAKIADLAAQEGVWLVCMEREYPCHRFLVKQVIERILVARGILKEPEDYSELFVLHKNLTRSEIKGLRERRKKSGSDAASNSQPIFQLVWSEADE